VTDKSEIDQSIGKQMKAIPTTIKNKTLVEQRRRQIVLAAIKLFSEKGFHKTTLRELAEEAQLSYGNIYDYVGSKEDIFSLIHDYAAKSAIQAIRSSIENVTDPVEKLRRIIRTEFSLMDSLSDAILLIYQDSHILSKPYLHKLLSLEREHLNLIEQTIEECLLTGRLKKCNVRLTANLIKSMIDSWVIKRWDLRGFADRLETEHSILELIFNGIDSRSAVSKHTENSTPRCNPDPRNALYGQSAFIINARTPIGTALCHFLSNAGVRLAVYVDSTVPVRENPVACTASPQPVRTFSAAEYGLMDAALYKAVERQMGRIDICLHEIGVGTVTLGGADARLGADRLAANLRSAEDIAACLQARTGSNQPKRVVYIAPWGWDQFLGPIVHATVQGGVLALTRSLARQTASRGMTVNCVLPGYIGTARPSRLQKQFKDKIKEVTPAGCLGEIRDVVEAVHFLINDSSKYITGQAFKLDGGGAHPPNV
jgi:AcrR family transcriptional regulator/NAD(P)-dependent dehydrogenase (short-subunit alcohol dehydrogenase family)